MRTHHKNIMGLSLTELAIVLGVVGAVVGGVWSLVTKQQESAKQIQFTDQLTTVVRNVRAAYAGKAAVGSTVGGGPSGAGDAATMTSAMKALNVFPPDMLSGGNVVLPWPLTAAFSVVGVGFTDQLYVCGWSGSAATWSCPSMAAYVLDAPLFAVEYIVNNQDVCAMSVLRNSGTGIPGLVDVAINKTSIVASGNLFPITPTKARSLCVGWSGGASPNVIDLVYKLVP